MADAVVWIPYCGAAPLPAEWLGRWNGDPWVLAGLVVAAIYGWWAALGGRGRSFFFASSVFLTQRRKDAKGADSPRKGDPSFRRDDGQRLWGRAFLFAFAWLLLFLLYVSPFCALTSALFSARVGHHVVLVAIVAPALVWALRASAGRLGWATAGQALVFWAWHAPPAYAFALSSDAGYWLMQASLFGSAFWFWAAIRRASAPAAAGALLATMVQMGLLGALITFAARPLYAPHFASTLAWGYGPLEDQQLAGLIMWAPAAGLYLAAALLLLGRWIGPDRPRIPAG